jgi:regulator of RNase E activity RraA
MAKLTETTLLEKLKHYDTPSITNAVATYPQDSVCLGLYEPWRQNWYTDTSIHCIYPELGPIVGYAVTVVYALPNPNFKRLTLTNLIEAFEKTKKPVILVIKQDFPPEMQNKVGLCGGQMTTAFKAAGAVGVVTNGPSRDVDEIRPMKFQYMMSGVTPGHGEFAISAINVPVTVAGMDVTPGDIIHMDENGACKFPADRLADVCTSVEEIVKAEGERMSNMRAAKNTQELKDVLSGKKIK